MTFSYGQVLLSIVPVFGLILAGVGLRRLRWVVAEADASILRLVVNCLYPALIFENVLTNDGLRNPANLIAAPCSGFVIMAFNIVAALYIGRALGLTQGHGLRTFAFTSGINNYGYFALAVCAALFDKSSIGMTLVHTVGGEAAIWTVGIFVLAGLSLREGWKKLFNGPVIALVLGLVLNLSGAREHLPQFFLATIHQMAVCALPIGIILIGCTLYEYLAQPRVLYHSKVTPISIVLRLGLFPLVYLVAAKYLPFTDEMKRVLIVQAAMPAGMIPVALAKHYNGQPLTAAQVVIGTTVLGIVTIPLWIKFGLAWIF